jgi:ribosomal protein S18
MPGGSPFPSVNEKFRYAANRIDHNNDACTLRRVIPERSRLSGTGATGSARTANAGTRTGKSCSAQPSSRITPRRITPACFSSQHQTAARPKRPSARERSTTRAVVCARNSILTALRPDLTSLPDHSPSYSRAERADEVPKQPAYTEIHELTVMVPGHV